MRKSVLFVMAVGLCLLFSCGEKKQAPADVSNTDKPESIFSKEDTATVFQLTETFIAKMKNNELDNALSMLYYLKNDSIVQLSKNQARLQMAALVNVRGVDYKIRTVQLSTETDNDVTLDIILFEKPEGDNRPNSIGFHLKPVRRDGTWYLTTADKHSDTRNQAHQHNESEEKEETPE